MHVEVDRIGTWKIVRPQTKRLDALVEVAFREMLEELLSPGESASVVIDLSHVDFVDSSGLGALVYARRLVGDDGRVAIASARAGVAATLRLTHLDQVMPLVHSPQAVLELAF